MRAEDKEVDGPDLERAERQRASELEQEDEADLAHDESEELRDIDLEHRGHVLAAMRTILSREQLVVNDLQLPKKELRALEALKAAVEGRDGQLGQFVYASDRSDLLEQALAVLQPTVGEMPGMFEELVHRVGDLRHGLKDLEDAQDELLEGHGPVMAAKADGETDDKPAVPSDEIGRAHV